MTIPESVRLQIIELKRQGRSIRQIAEETGVGKNTVSRVVESAACPQNRADARARATNELSPKNGDRNGDRMGTAKAARVTVMEVRTITRDMTIAELFSLLQKAKADLEIARRENDGSKDAVMAVSTSTRVVTEILKEMGRWCGLQDSIKTVDVSADKPPTEYTLDEALALAEALCSQ